MFKPILSFSLLAAALLAAGCDRSADVQATNATLEVAAHAPANTSGFDTFVTAAELEQLREATPELVVVDVRSSDEYAAGHIPDAINLPGETLRTGKAKPGEGDSQYVFRLPDGSPDVLRYERLLGDAGLTRDTPVVLYGNHGGKGDGTVPAMLLDWLGHDNVRFLDGIGMTEWAKIDGPIESQPNTLPPARYEASPREGFVWTVDDVVAGVESGAPLFYDTRSLAEFEGTELRDNARGGRIPGAVHADYAELLDADKTLKPREEIEALFAAHGLPAAKAANRPIVLYCQTSTRVSLPYLLLRDLGYENIVVYDASWHEYGNRPDTPIETNTPSR